MGDETPCSHKGFHNSALAVSSLPPASEDVENQRRLLSRFDHAHQAARHRSYLDAFGGVSIMATGSTVSMQMINE